MREEFLLESSIGDPDRSRVLDEMLVVERTLMLEQGIVHFPETSETARALGGFRGMLGVRMHLAEREISEHEPEPCSKALLNLPDDRIRLSAVRTFVVAIFDERHARGRRPLEVIALADGQHERRGRVRIRRAARTLMGGSFRHGVVRPAAPRARARSRPRRG